MGGWEGRGVLPECNAPSSRHPTALIALSGAFYTILQVSRRGPPPGPCSTGCPHERLAPSEQGGRPSWTKACTRRSSAAASLNVNVVTFVTFAVTPPEPDQTGNQTNEFARKAVE